MQTWRCTWGCTGLEALTSSCRTPRSSSGVSLGTRGQAGHRGPRSWLSAKAIGERAAFETSSRRRWSLRSASSGDDRAQAEADFWEGSVAGVNELVEGSLDSQELRQRIGSGEAEFQIDDE